MIDKVKFSLIFPPETFRVYECFRASCGRFWDLDGLRASIIKDVKM